MVLSIGIVLKHHDPVDLPSRLTRQPKVVELHYILLVINGRISSLNELGRRRPASVSRTDVVSVHSWNVVTVRLGVQLVGASSRA